MIQIWRSCEFSKIRYDTASREYIKTFIKQENRVLARKKLWKTMSLSSGKIQLMKEEGPESKIEQLCRERERGNLIKEG
jgi:hypothetical protein